MKKKLLFIEDQALHFDQAAGARTSYMYLELLLDMDLSVTFIGADFEEVEPYTSHLRELGVKVKAGKAFKFTWILWFFLFARQFDYVFFNRPHPTKKFIKLVKLFSRAKVLYQCHDLHYLRLRRQYDFDKNEKTLELSQLIKELEIDLIRKSDIFLTFSRFEKSEIDRMIPGKRTEAIPLFFYDRLNPPVTNFSERRGILFVGGFRHQPNTDAVLWFARDIFPRIREHHPDVIFYVVGSHPPEEITALAGDGVEVLGYVSDQRLAQLYGHVRLVVVPLRFGAGVKGKTVEAIHHSLPLVSTSIGSEGIGLEAIVPAADTPAAFADRVVSLYGDQGALRETSLQLHQYARANLTTTAAKEKMGFILDSLG